MKPDEVSTLMNNFFLPFALLSKRNSEGQQANIIWYGVTVYHPFRVIFFRWLILLSDTEVSSHFGRMGELAQQYLLIHDALHSVGGILLC